MNHSDPYAWFMIILNKIEKRQDYSSMSDIPTHTHWALDIVWSWCDQSGFNVGWSAQLPPIQKDGVKRQ